MNNELSPLSGMKHHALQFGCRHWAPLLPKVDTARDGPKDGAAIPLPIREPRSAIKNTPD